MKRLLKLAFIALLMSQVASCGKNNDSGGSSSNNNSISAPGFNGDYNSDHYNNSQTQNGESFGDIIKLREGLQAKGLNSGLSNGMSIYHVGSYFGASNSGGSFDYCINLIFKSWGNCDNGGAQQIESIINSGQYKVVRSSSTSRVEFDEATGVQSSSQSGDDFYFTARYFDRQDSLYRAMLGLDNGTPIKTVVTAAQVSLSDGKTIKADLVEYFYSETNVKRYVLSSALPLLANPIAIMDSNGNVTGRLNNVGGVSVTGVSAQLHSIQRNYYSGQVQVYPIGIINF